MKIFFISLFIFSNLYTMGDNPYKGDNAIINAEFIFSSEDVPFPSCHASTICETSDGLLASWFGGTHEKHKDVGIWISRFVKGNWTVPVEVANGVQHSKLRYPTWNPVLFNYGDEIFLFYKAGPDPKRWWGEYIISADDGKTWTRPCRLPEEIYGPIKNKPELLSTGELICPSSTEDKGWRVHMEFTDDRCISWERTNAINDGNKVGAIQPCILKHPEHKLQILCRSRNREILSAWSSDNGRTWTELVSVGLPNPNSGIDAVTLKDGRHVLVYNHIDPAGEWGDRNILNIAVSYEGIDWHAAVLLENDRDQEGEYSYPAVIQSGDGMVHVVYTWNRKLIKHVVVDPAKFELKPISNGKWPVLK